MLDTIWTVSGESLDVDAFTKQIGLPAISQYRKGEIYRKVKVWETSGLKFLISENLNNIEHLNDIYKFITANKKSLMYAKEQRYNSSFEMGCTVGTEEQFTKSIELDPALLGLFSECGISFEFSAYPASDNE